MSFEFFLGAIDLSPYLYSGYPISRGLYLMFHGVPKSLMDEINLMNRGIAKHKIAAFHRTGNLTSAWKLVGYHVRAEYADFDPCMTIQYSFNGGRLLIRLDER